MTPTVVWEGYIEGQWVRLWQIGPDAFIYSFAAPPREHEGPLVFNEIVNEAVKVKDGDKQLITYEETFPVGAKGWTNSQNITALDDKYASHITNGSRTEELIASGFNMEIPLGMQVEDIIVSVYRRLI